MKNEKDSAQCTSIDIDASIPPKKLNLKLELQPKFQFSAKDNPYNFRTDDEYDGANFWGTVNAVEESKVNMKKQLIDGVEKVKGKAKVS